MFGQVTALDITTLVIAVVGALTGVASLAWTVASHALSGARVKVELKAGWLGGGGAVTLPFTNFGSVARPEGIDGPAVVVVEARNVGRLPCSVVGWGVSVGSAQLGHVQLPVNPALPHRLEVGEEGSWFVEMHSVLALIATLRETNVPATHLSGKVSLGDGRVVESPRCRVPV